MGRRDYDPGEIDQEILPLVELLNELEAIETYSSCAGHEGERVFSRTPCVAFWLARTETGSGEFTFTHWALRQLGTLAWVLSRTFEDGFHELSDWDHRHREPVASVRVAGEGPHLGRDEVPELWSPVAYSLQVRDRAHLPLVVETLRQNWPIIRGRGVAPS